LTDILMELGFADILTAPLESDTILQAAGKRILSKFGNWHPDRFRQIIAAIINVPPVVWPVMPNKVMGEYGGAQAPKSPRVVKIGRAKDAKDSESERAGKPKGGRRKAGAGGTAAKQKRKAKGEETERHNDPG